jgi:hypothetical protein
MSSTPPIPGSAGAALDQRIRSLQALVPIVTGQLLDNGRVGCFVACVGRVFAGANADTVFSHVLARTPNGFLLYRASVGGTLYDASDGVTSWSSTQIKIRATQAGTYSFLLF